MQDNILYEVRCPNNAWKGNTNRTVCNMLCGRVNALTVGEFHCRKCKVLFNFIVNEDGTVSYVFEPTEVKRRYDHSTAEDRLFNTLEKQDN